MLVTTHTSLNLLFMNFNLFVLQMENNDEDDGYAEVILGRDEIAVAASPVHKAHALVNIDSIRSIFFIGCQDNVVSYNASSTDFNVWKDL